MGFTRVTVSIKALRSRNGVYESLFLVAKKNGEAAAGRSDGTDVHFDNGLTHTASLYSPSRKDPNYCPPRWRPTTVSGVPEQPDVSPNLWLSIMPTPPSQTARTNPLTV